MSLFTLGARLAADARRLATTIRIPKEDAIREIRRLACHALRLTPAQLAVREREAPGRFDLSPYGIVFDRRLKGEPIQYIMGECGFRDHVFRITPDVLIPRPETEELVEAALNVVPEDREFAVLDVGTGSGCIAVSLALSRPSAVVTAIDFSEAALAVAAGNAERLGARNVQFVHSHWYEKVAGTQFDLIVSNPPYVVQVDPHLETLKFEPAAALVAGPDGLDALRAVVSRAPQHLVAGGVLLVEHGYDQQDAVCELFAGAGFSAVTGARDLSGKPRMVAGRWQANDGESEHKTTKPRKRRTPVSA